MTPSQAFDQAVHHAKNRWEDAPLITTIKTIFYLSMVAMTLITGWTLRRAGYVILEFPIIEKQVGKLEIINAGPRLDSMEKSVKELQDLHPRQP